MGVMTHKQLSIEPLWRRPFYFSLTKKVQDQTGLDRRLADRFVRAYFRGSGGLIYVCQAFCLVSIVGVLIGLSAIMPALSGITPYLPALTMIAVIVDFVRADRLIRLAAIRWLVDQRCLSCGEPLTVALKACHGEEVICPKCGHDSPVGVYRRFELES